MENSVQSIGPFAIMAGDEFALQMTFKVNGVAQDMSSWTFTSHWRSRVGSEEAVAFDVDGSTLASGVLVLTLTSEQTRAMAGPGVFDVQGVDGATVKTFVTGTTVWQLDVTRA